MFVYNDKEPVILVHEFLVVCFCCVSVFFFFKAHY